MSTKKKDDLGKGIRALLGGINDEWNDDDTSGKKVSSPANGISDIALTSIEINPFQPRADFDEDGLKDLAESISVHGVIQPITVRAVGGDKYQLISGERRLRASKMAGRKSVPAYIRMANDQEMLEMALIENIQREDLNSIEIAINYKRLIDECELTQEELGKRVGKGRTTVTNHLRLLKLPPDIQKGIKDKKISMGHARAITGVEDPTVQLEIYKETLKKDLSVRKVEALTRSYQKPVENKDKKAPNTSLPLAYQKIQDELASLLSSQVKLKRFKDDKGEIIISYYSDDDLNRILDLLADT